MSKQISIDKKGIEFRLIESTDYWCWQGYLDIDNENIAFEIDSEFYKGEINWASVEGFLKFITKTNLIRSKSEEGLDSITSVGMNFFSNSNEIKEWKMKFKNSIYFLGVANNGNYEYGILYDYVFESNGIIDGDAYGLYMVKMQNDHFLNAKRYQL